MEKYDVMRDLRALYAPRNTDWSIRDVPEQQFLVIDGIGNPNSAAAYAAAGEALYAVAYTLKFANRKQGERDFVVASLEGLWFNEGRCAQALHVGSYDAEGPLLAGLHGPYFADHGLEFAEPHHEVYLSDPRRTDPARLKTVCGNRCARSQSTPDGHRRQKCRPRCLDPGHRS